MDLPRIQILMSTYNGAQFIGAQVDSIVGQSYPHWRLRVRDDGSTDATWTIVADRARRDGRIDVEGAANVGVVRSFFHLLERADADADLYAFADQDDVWLPDKLTWAVERMAALDPGRPALCAARLEYVTSDLTHLGFSPLPRRPGFANALVQNVTTGCTVLINAAARRLLLARPPGRVIMHDWWTYLTVAGLGRIVFDSRPAVRYRQHAGNVIGATPSGAEEMRRRWRRFRNTGGGIFLAASQAREFERCHGAHLGPEERRVLRRFLDSKRGWLARLRYALTKDVYRDQPLDDLLLRALIVSGRY